MEATGEEKEMRQSVWSEVEDEILRTYYPVSRMSYLLKLIPGKTKFAIYNRCGILGIRKAENGAIKFSGDKRTTVTGFREDKDGVTVHRLR
jgi:hypothetical protein